VHEMQAHRVCVVLDLVGCPENVRLGAVATVAISYRS
jgi:hypothetical protein